MVFILLGTFEPPPSDSGDLETARTGPGLQLPRRGTARKAQSFAVPEGVTRITVAASAASGPIVGGKSLFLGSERSSKILAGNAVDH